MRHSQNLPTLLAGGVTAILLSMSGCAGHMTKADCEKTNFYDMGVSDGKYGSGSDRLNRFQSACPSQGVVLNQAQYDYGRKEGLIQRCSDSKGKQDAKNNKPESICVNEKVPPYVKAYNAQLDEMKKQKEDELKKLQSSQKDISQKANDTQSDLNKMQNQQPLAD